jgi:hypothetical protein
MFNSSLNDTPHKRGLRSIINDSKTGSPFTAAVFVNVNAVAGDMMDISRFIGDFTGMKNTADFEFSLRCDEGGILENL